MISRRDVVKGGLGLGCFAAAAHGFGAVGGRLMIEGFVRRDETIVRGGGSGAVQGLTWTGDDRMLASVLEGGGWPGGRPELYFSSGLVEVEGSPADLRFDTVKDYPAVSMREWFRPNGQPLYYGPAVIAVGHRLYQYFWTFNGTALFVDKPMPERGGSRIKLPSQHCTKLIYSDDGGQTWRNQDGSHPVVFEPADKQSSETMLFWNAPRNLFSWITLAQMGKAYSANRDGYVYGYSAANYAELPKAVSSTALFRVPKGELTNRAAYQFYAGGSGAAPKWTADIEASGSVLDLPEGWTCTSVVYNERLALFMMSAFRDRTIDVYSETYAPSSIGFWVSPSPWGPWRSIGQEASWLPGGRKRAWCTAPKIAPKWIGADGRSFWLTWAELQGDVHYRAMYEQWWFAKTEAEWNQWSVEWRARHPDFRFNAQRVDLLA